MVCVFHEVPSRPLEVPQDEVGIVRPTDDILRAHEATARHKRLMTLKLVSGYDQLDGVILGLPFVFCVELININLTIHAAACHEFAFDWVDGARGHASL